MTERPFSQWSNGQEPYGFHFIIHEYDGDTHGATVELWRNDHCFQVNFTDQALTDFACFMRDWVKLP